MTRAADPASAAAALAGALASLAVVVATYGLVIKTQDMALSTRALEQLQTTLVERDQPKFEIENRPALSTSTGDAPNAEIMGRLRWDVEIAIINRGARDAVVRRFEGKFGDTWRPMSLNADAAEVQERLVKSGEIREFYLFRWMPVGETGPSEIRVEPAWGSGDQKPLPALDS